MIYTFVTVEFTSLFLELNAVLSQSCGSTLDTYEAATRVTNNWYSEEEEFDYDANEYTHDSSHFCQLVWKGN